MLKQFRSTPQKLVNSNFNEKKIEDLIKNQEAVLNNSTTLNERLNMLYNIINMRQSIGDSNHNYRDIKDLINTYINLIQTSDYGYDTFNYDKLEKVISKLTYKEQISILNYSLSILAREYPEYEKDWFLNELNKAKIKKILCEKDFCNYPKAFLLFAGAPSMILCK